MERTVFEELKLASVSVECERDAHHIVGGAWLAVILDVRSVVLLSVTLHKQERIKGI